MALPAGDVKNCVDRLGAELFLGKGNFDAKLYEEHGSVLVQASFLTDGEISLVVQTIQMDNV